MTFAKRYSLAATALFVAAVVVVCMCAVNGKAYAAYTAGTQSEALAVQQNMLSTAASSKLTKGQKMATAAAKMSYSRKVRQAQGTGTKAYMKICRKLTGNGYYAKDKNQMKCNVPIAAAVRSSGVDKRFPLTTDGQYTYMRNSKNWKCLGNYKGDESKLKPGDILIRIGGTTKYRDKYGYMNTAATNHVCMYVGKSIATKVYKKNLKGTDADAGKPGSKRTFVSAHMSRSDASNRSAACLEKASEAYADYRMLVFRHR